MNIKAVVSNVIICVFCLTAVVLTGTGNCIAQERAGVDLANLEPNLPLRVVDAVPIPSGARQIQAAVRYQDPDEGKKEFYFQPRIAAGIAPNLQVAADVPYIDNSDEKGSGDIGLEALYRFNTESGQLPSFALMGRFEIPTGKESSGLDTVLKLIATKSFRSEALMQRAHLNLEWKRNSGRDQGERENLYAAVLGVDIPVNKSMLLVADIFREQQRKEGKYTNMFELGIRSQIRPDAVISLGGGIGLWDESPDWRVLLGFQFSF
ncbi:MAG TPA: hypothetical protein PK587_11195 [Syntrophales bacterium]|nr:hypothetical protein [Syntrophales bacterium]